MTILERIRAAIHGEQADRIPMTIYPGLFPRGETERLLRNNGVGLHHRAGVCGITQPHITHQTTTYREDGEVRVRDTLITPVGEVYQTWRLGTALGGRVRTDFYFKRPEDYRVLEYYVKDMVIEPAYDSICEAQDLIRDDGYVSGNLGYSPMQDMIVNLMGIEGFSDEWHERRDEVVRLYDLMVEKHRQMFEVAANAPVDLVIYGDNVTSEIIGRERYEKFCLTIYDEFAETLHAKGKLAASHLDGMMRDLREPTARCKLDLICAFACAPDGDVTIGEAMEWWPGKVFWINYPSSVHLKSPEEIERDTIALLQDAAPATRLLVGVTEDMPKHCWQTSAVAISDALVKHGKLPIEH